MYISNIVIGTTFKKTVTLPNYPASQGWTLHYKINTSTPLVLDSTADGDTHTFLISATTTATYTAGNYAYQIYISNMDGEIYPLGTGTVAFEAFGTISNDRKIYEAILAVIAGTATNEFESMSVNGRMLKYFSPIERENLRNIYAGRVAAEERKRKAAAGVGASNQVLVAFR